MCFFKAYDILLLMTRQVITPVKRGSYGGKMSLIEQIIKLKKEKNVLILAHYYQIPEIQELADFVGDSLALAQVGKNAKEELIVVCGVRFMAESAKILSPDKKVLIPRMDAGCPMADMVDYDSLKQYKEDNPDRYIVSYVNTTANVKTLTDICVTSSNAMKIMENIQSDKILFLPDKNLGGYIKKQMPNKDIELWPGFCLTHQRLQKESVIEKKSAYPNALVLAHPECNEGVLEVADFIGSTKGILDYVDQSSHPSFIIATEDGIMHPLTKKHPDKEFILASSRLVCQNMKKITVEDLLHCLQYETEEMLLTTDVILEAKKPLDKMLQQS